MQRLKVLPAQLEIKVQKLVYLSIPFIYPLNVHIGTLNYIFLSVCISI